MAVALRGNLTDFGIAEVFQLIGQQRKTGILDIQEKKLHARLAFDGGSVVWAAPVGASEHAVLGDRLVRCGLLTRARLSELIAEGQSSARSLPALLVASGAVREEELAQIRDLLTRDTIFQVLRLSSGSFDFSAQTVRHDVPAASLLPAEQILMDGLRMVDEWRTFAADVPSGDGVFEATGGLEDYRRRAQGDSRNRLPSTERVFQLVDGRLPVARIIDLSRIGTFEATRALAELRRNGLIALREGATGSSRVDLEPGSSRLLEHARTVFAAVLPFVLLAAAAFYALQQQALAPRGVALDRSPIGEARQIWRARGLAFALDAHRFATAEWPERLDGPDPTGLLERTIVAESPADAYYYAQRDGGYVLLSPRH